MTSLPLWARVLAFLGAVFAVWMISDGIFGSWLFFQNTSIGSVMLIALFLALQVFVWWRLWTLMVIGRQPPAA